MSPPNLDSLPMEITDQVASNLLTRSDLWSLAQSCKAVNQLVTSRQATCLRILFRRSYDLPAGKARKKIEEELKHRDRLGWGKVVFSLGVGCPMLHLQDIPQEAAHLQLAKDLIVESYAGLPKPTVKPIKTQVGDSEIIVRYVSQNLKRLKQLVYETNLMDCNKYWAEERPFSGNPTVLLQIVWLLSVQWQLEEASSRAEARSPAYNFLFSQKAVYARPTSTGGGLFIDHRSFTVNVKLLVNIANFFKFYFTAREGYPMYDRFQDLEPWEKPQAWRQGILQGPQRLGRYWKGSYAYMTDQHVSEIRTTPSGHTFFPDQLDELDGFATLELYFAVNPMEWPRDYGDELESIPPACLLELLKKYPQNWIDEQDSAVEFSRSESDYLLEQRALRGDTDAQIELEWRKHTQNLQIHREDYEGAKQKFVSDWKEHETSRSSHASGFTLSDPTASITSKRGKRHRGTRKPSPAALLCPTVNHGIDYHQFRGHGIDGRCRFNCVGNVHAIPPVEGIPGWQRITMMKETEDGNKWCYEGVVFPGNIIMMGRYWKMGDTDDRLRLGPFIYWNIDR